MNLHLALGLIVGATLLQACLSDDESHLYTTSPASPASPTSPIDSSDQCSLMPSTIFNSTNSNTDQSRIFCTLKSSEETGLEIFKDTRGYGLSITPQSPVENWWDSYAGFVFIPEGIYCSVNVDSADLPWKVTAVRASDGSTVWSRADSLTQAKVSDYFATIPGEKYFLIFSHINKDTSSATYRGIQLNCTQASDTIAPVPVTEKINSEIVGPMLNGQAPGAFPNANSIITTFESLATKVYSRVVDGEDDSALAVFLKDAYNVNLPILQTTHGTQLQDNDPRVLFSSYLAQFAVRLSHLNLNDARSIIIAKNGTCQQQAQVAAYFYELLTDTKIEMTVTDWLVLGHMVTKGPNFFIDATDNIVVYVSVADWNAKSVEERIATLKSSAVFGYSLDLDITYPNPYADQLGGVDVVKQNVVDQVGLLPLAGIQPQGIPIIRSSFPFGLVPPKK